MDEEIAKDTAEQTFDRRSTEPPHLAWKKREQRRDEHQQPNSAEELGKRRNRLPRPEPAETQFRASREPVSTEALFKEGSSGE
jgi:hypothetical protein